MLFAQLQSLSDADLYALILLGYIATGPINTVQDALITPHTLVVQSQCHGRAADHGLDGQPERVNRCAVAR